MRNRLSGAVYIGVADDLSTSGTPTPSGAFADAPADRPPQPGPTIALCLSGGGFRAALFHLGVVRLLSETGLLKKVWRIDSVSGGSVLAAHLVLNWDAYCENAEEASRKLVTLIQRDVRGRVVRRRLFLWTWFAPIWLWLLKRLTPERLTARFKLYSTDLLEREYSTLYGAATLEAVSSPTRKDGPDLYLHATSLTTGRPCAFAARLRAEVQGDTPGGAWFVRWLEDTPVEFSADQITLSRAVAASSAFPPLFTPIEVSAKDVAPTDTDGFGVPEALTDGGVYDNLGIHRLCKKDASYDWVIVSDAGGAIDRDDDRSFRNIFSRNIRASDLLMYRNGVLQRRLCNVDIKRDFKGDSEDGTSAASARPLMLSARIRPDNFEDDEQLGPVRQAAIRNLRTDLNTFSIVEIQHLIHHGFAVAAAMVRRVDPGRTIPEAPKIKSADIETLLHGSKRAWGLWAPRDPVGMLYAVALCLWIGLFAWVGFRAWNQTALTLTSDSWPAATQAWLNEPSDLAFTGLTRRTRQVLLSVDDEESGLFVVQMLPGGEATGVIGALDIRPQSDSSGALKELKDLEAVAFDPCKGTGIAVTSHRRRDKKETSHLIRFKLPESFERKADSSLVLSSTDLRGVIEKALTQFVPDALQSWSREEPEPETEVTDEPSSRVYYPYAIEIEGAAYRGDEVTFGLKQPLTGDNQAILLKYSFQDGGKVTPEPIDLEGQGISALTWIGEALYVAANPRGKERTGVETKYPFNASAVYRFGKDGARRLVPDLKATEPDAKLEGLAAVGNDLMGAFDGPGHKIRKIGLVDPEDRVTFHWWDRVRQYLTGWEPDRCSN